MFVTFPVPCPFPPRRQRESHSSTLPTQKRRAEYRWLEVPPNALPHDLLPLRSRRWRIPQHEFLERTAGRVRKRATAILLWQCLVASPLVSHLGAQSSG